MAAAPHAAPAPRRDTAPVAAAVVLLAAAGAALSLLVGTALPPVAALLVATAAALGAVAAARTASGRVPGATGSWVAGLAGAIGAGAAGAWAAVSAAWSTGVPVTAAVLVVPVHAALALLVLAWVVGRGWRVPLDPAAAGRAVVAARRPLVAGVTSLPLVLTLLAGPAVAPATAAAVEDPAVAPCVAGEQVRNYAVSAITVDVPFNRWGKTLRSARIFAMDQDLAAVRNWHRPLAASAADDPAANRRLRPRPLVLRANEGECIRVTLTNRLSSEAAHGLPGDPRVGIQAAGVVMNVRRSGGARVGYNADPTVGIGESISYFWRVPDQEGLYMFEDLATPAGGEHDAGSRGVGLYGGLAVQPAGSTWTDPRSGKVLSGTPGALNSTYAAVRNQSGELYIEADIHPPGGDSFRESIQLAQDEIPDIGMGFNYGSEPLEDRETALCPDCVGEETWLSSWPYGDPALVKLASGRGPWLPNGEGDRKDKEDCGLPESCYVSNVFHTYTGDATKIRFGLAGVKETHVFHLHAHQWLADAREDVAQGDGPGYKPGSSTIDSQSYGPGEAYSAELLYGAGSQNGTFGDSIFHCHLYPHFAEGFWAIMRVHDVRLDGRSATPDGVNVRPLQPLPDAPAPPQPTADNPGFPGMIPGTYGYRAPQPPGSVTVGGVDGTPERPAPRVVGGRPIAEGKLALEEGVVARHNPGGEAPRGAPFADPCPSGSREVDYAVTVLQRDLVYNTAGHHDPQARVMVLTKDVEAVLAGTKKVEPLFIRANAGDCINFSLTNMTHNWAGNDVFQKLVQTNMAGGHVHLTKFDVTASDGGSNGWNYQQAAFTKEQADFVEKQAAGEVRCTPSDTFYGGESTGCRIPYDWSWQPPADSSGLWGQTIHERWYADYELRTAFTHDHHFPAVTQNHGHYGALVVEPAGFDVRDPETGEFRQPVNDPAHGTVCGARCDGDADGEAADLVGPGANDDYREFGLAVADFVSLVKKGGNPRNPDDAINPPGAPESFPSNDPGTFSVNYRNEPLHERRTRNGQPVDPAHRFSSWVFGDPYTPLLQAYSRDNVKFRLIQGSHEEQHMFQVHRLRWLEEPDDPDSPLVNAQTIGISEAFNVEMPGYDCRATDTPCRGDHLYGATTPEGLWNGMWGVLRVHGQRTAGLLPLPDNTPREATVPEPVPASRQAPPPAQQTGTSCPDGAPVKRYDVVAMANDLVYNEHGDHDPKGALFVLAEDEAAVRAGTKAPEPLVLRANEGDCVRVTLHNALPANYGDLVNGTDGDIRYTLEPPTGTRMGTRVSLHPQMLRHDVRLSDGSAVGFNPDSTVGINGTISYEWYADREVGATNLVDYGDVRGHRHHGLFAGLVVEPRNATYHDPVTGAEVRSGVSADVRVPGLRDFRENVLFYEDGLDLRDATGAAVVDTVHPGAADEVPTGREDHGDKGVNYTNAPLHRRLGAPAGAQADVTSAAWSTVFSSAVHGDPRTPVLRAYAGDDQRVRLLNGSAKAPPAYFGSFQLDGASWRAEPYDPQSERVGLYGNLGSGGAKNVHVGLATPGDHLWASKTSLQLPSGVWGMARVYPQPTAGAGFTPTPLRRVDNPYGLDNVPILPLERASVTVAVFDDADADGARDEGEAVRVGVPVELRATDGTVVSTVPTTAAGTATFSPTPGVYDVAVSAPQGTSVVGAPTRRVDVRGDVAPARLAVGVTSRVVLTARVFDDRDGDGVRDEGEPGLAGRTVQLDGPVPVADGTTGADGTATAAVVAGTWKAYIAPRTGWTATTPLPAVVTVSGTAPVSVDLGVRRDPGVVVRVVDDVDGSGTAGPAEAGVPGVLVDATLADGSALSRRTGVDGAVVDTRAQAATLRVLGPDMRTWPCVSAVVTLVEGSTTVVTCDAAGAFAVPADAVEVSVLGAFDDGVVSVQLFQDADSDGRRGPTEPALADWPVVLQDPVTHTEVARGTTGADGLTGFLVPPGDYEVVPLPPVSDVAWTNTVGDYAITVERAQRAQASGGWVQRASVSASVFHDLDGNGRRDDYDPPLAERTVRLLDSAGRLRSTAVTDSTGSAVFPVTAGASYSVETTVPSGWRATGPLSGTTVQSRVPLTAPADGSQAVVAFGQYNTVDRTPPARPVLTPAGGVLDRPTLVGFSAETGATIRYTLDGSTPTATRGMVVSGDVRIATDRVVQAVAVDAAGNVSAVASATFDLPWTGAVTRVGAGAWQATTGTVRGTVADAAVDDNRYLSVSAGLVASRRTADVTARVVLPEAARTPAALDVSMSARTTLRNVRVRLQYWDNEGGLWRNLLTPYTSGLDEQRVDLDLPGAGRAVAADGTVLVRVVADTAQPFDLQVDQLTVTAVNRR
ncbi:SdrD B-like domain-containing protein [Aquipuribacter nitratireducens]|uniref:SdrD B-like domain-containing protein n=1 Tax=Aquipuribacter nitratireducens TaxID=650104 RepID=A0ABW0GH01_9MICO